MASATTFSTVAVTTTAVPSSHSGVRRQEPKDTAVLGRPGSDAAAMASATPRCCRWVPTASAAALIKAKRQAETIMASTLERVRKPRRPSPG